MSRWCCCLGAVAFGAVALGAVALGAIAVGLLPLGLLHWGYSLGAVALGANDPFACSLVKQLHTTPQSLRNQLFSLQHSSKYVQRGGARAEQQGRCMPRSCCSSAFCLMLFALGSCNCRASRLHGFRARSRQICQLPHGTQGQKGTLVHAQMLLSLSGRGPVCLALHTLCSFSCKAECFEACLKEHI